MAYESILYIVERVDSVYGSPCITQIAKFVCEKMESDNGWKELFDKPIDYKLYMDDGNTEFDKDAYGEHLTYTNIANVIKWLEKEMKRNYNYRLKPLLALLKGFDLSEWRAGELQVIHYGY